jgi:1-acyl-sn-glycerol-3-phosphate acyltransferase
MPAQATNLKCRATRGSLSPRGAFASSKKPAASVPRISTLLLKWFTWYSRRYLRRHFHSLRVSVAGLPSAWREMPLVLYLNHASWWDPLVCLILKAEFFPDRAAFAPIDAAMLKRYNIFSRLGFFPVEQHSHRGANQFFRTALAILDSPGSLLALTPQSRFADARERPPRFESGIGHLAARVTRARFVPVAIEYGFWEERLPEILVRFGEPVDVRFGDDPNFDAKSWASLFEQKLADTQDALALDSRRRNPADFHRVLHGNSGQGGTYDWWRSLTAKYRGESFTKEHGRK